MISYSNIKNHNKLNSMKAKNLLFSGALILLGLTNVKNVIAENTDNVYVSLKFRPVQSIVINADSVNLIYATASDYNTGKDVEQADHITLFSTGGFTVHVKASADFTRTAGGTIPVGDVLIVASAGSKASNGTTTFAPATGLSETGHSLITSDKGGRDIKYNVKYDNKTAGGSDNYIDKFIAVDVNESVYTTTVTYTIAAN